MALHFTKGKEPSTVGGSKIRGVHARAIILLVLVVAIGGVYLRFAWDRYQNIAASEAVMLAESLSVLLHPEHVAELSGGVEDLTKPEYMMAKLSLRRLVETTNPIRFAYLMGERDGDIVILIDSEPSDSPDYSPPGQVYEEADVVTRSLFRTGETILTKPTTDRWGRWISALVPIKAPMSGEVVAVFGIDYPASAWHTNLLKRMIPDGIVVFCLLFLTFGLLLMWMEHIKLMVRSRKLAFDEALYRSVFDQAPIGVAIVEDKNFVSESEYSSMNMNPMFEHILGRTIHDLENIAWTEITHPDDLQADLEQFEQFHKGEINGYSMEKRFIRPDGSSVWTNMKISALTGSNGARSIHLCLLEDISGRKQIEGALRESERSKSVLLSHLPGMAYRCRYDRDWTMLFVSEGCQALTGYEPESLLHNRDLTYNDLVSSEYREMLWNEWSRVLGRRANFRQEYEILTKIGERKWVLELAQGIFDAKGNVEALEGIVIDVSQQKKREAQISYLSERDFLTGLYNRSHFEDEENRLDQPEYWPLSIAICDINGVRLINDAFGHAEGDHLIVDVAKLIRSCCRKGDILARTGGDEFTLLLPRTSNDAARQLVTEIYGMMEGYNRSGERSRYAVSLCVGYCTKESSEQSMEEVTKTAQVYLNHSKLLNHGSSHNAILSSILATLYAKSQETEEHGRRLTFLTGMIGHRLGLEQKALDDLELFSMLHDIGKIGVDDRILNKPGKLTPDEWEQMKKHTEIGNRIAMSTPELEHMAEYILHHHERWDGMGYPTGLKGSEIPLPSRILMVADAYDAMTEDRVYREAMPLEAAVREIERCAGTQFDPEIAQIFVDLIRSQKNPPVNLQNTESRVE